MGFGSKIGVSAKRHDGASKAAGSEKYSADVYPAGFIWAKAVRAGISAGELVNLDVSQAEKVRGVLRVLTAKDVKGTNRYGIIHKDTPVLADKEIKYAGDAVALVLAESKDALNAACGLVKADIIPFVPMLNPHEAMKPDARQIHENMPGNLLSDSVISIGGTDIAFKKCHAVVEGKFRTPVQVHAFLETENGTAQMDGEKLRMTVSTQSPFRDRFEISGALGIPFYNIIIKSPALGGGFGGKDGVTVQCLLGLAAMYSGGRHVRMVWDRKESFAAGYKRHPAEIKFRLGADEEGKLLAAECDILLDTGAYAHLGGEVLELAMEHASGPYIVPNVLINGKAVYTNNAVSGAMRAFGVCQSSFAAESMMDMLAESLGMCPLELRLKNILRRGETNSTGTMMETSVNIEACLKTVRSHPLWTNRHEWKKQAEKHKVRGAGIAAVWNASGYGKKVRDSAIAKVELTPDGKIAVYNGVADMGQGNASAFMQIAGEILNQNADSIIIHPPDTENAMPSGSSSAGRTTYTYGNALISACKAMGEKLINRAGLILFTETDEQLELLPEKVKDTLSGREIALKDIASMLPHEDRFCFGHYVAPVFKGADVSKGIFVGFPHVLFAFGAHLAYTETDMLTGRTEVCEYLAVTDAGAVINPMLFHQQVHGGVVQGMGYALMEEISAPEGIILNNSFTDYIIPGSPDVPDVVSVICPSYEETGPFGLKGVGEIALNGAMPAIGNAIADGLGIRLFDAPFTPEKVLKCTGKINDIEI